MNDDLMDSIIPMTNYRDDGSNYGTITSSATTPLTISTSNIISGTIVGNGAIGAIVGSSFDDKVTVVEHIMDKWIMNRVTVDHKVAAHELLKLQEVAPDYANEIKENIAKNSSRDMVKKLTFTKKHDKDADVHHFIGRVWMFTEEELKEFIKEVRNA
jgi:hypothetical protein